MTQEKLFLVYEEKYTGIDLQSSRGICIVDDDIVASKVSHILNEEIGTENKIYRFQDIRVGIPEVVKKSKLFAELFEEKD